MNRCELCKENYAECYHHLIFGYGMRKLADQDQLVIHICNRCHNMSDNSIHNNPLASELSKKLGQALWEAKAIARCVPEGMQEKIAQEAREAFRERYGRSYL